MYSIILISSIILSYFFGDLFIKYITAEVYPIISKSEIPNDMIQIKYANEIYTEYIDPIYIDNPCIYVRRNMDGYDTGIIIYRFYRTHECQNYNDQLIIKKILNK